MKAPPNPRPNEPILGLPLEAKPLRITLYVLTVSAFGAALFLEPALSGAVERGALSPEWTFVPFAAFGVFFLAYAIDRYVLVRRRRYPAGKAFFQVALGVFCGLLLLPSTRANYGKATAAQKASDTAESVADLLGHPQAVVRQAAIQALAYRGASSERAAQLGRALEDQEASHRRLAAQILAKWSGIEASDLPGLKKWVQNPQIKLMVSTSTPAKGVR